MNKITYRELKSCVRANLGSFDLNTKSIHIPKYHEIKLEEHNTYIVKLKSTITNPGANSVLAVNWNKGSIPKFNCYKIQILKIMSTMINVVGIAYDYENDKDLNEMWTGWLPIPEITVLKKL